LFHRVAELRGEFLLHLLRRCRIDVIRGELRVGDIFRLRCRAVGVNVQVALAFPHNMESTSPAAKAQKLCVCNRAYYAAAPVAVSEKWASTLLSIAYSQATWKVIWPAGGRTVPIAGGSAVDRYSGRPAGGRRMSTMLVRILVSVSEWLDRSVIVNRRW
jgi:hypothetical protein